MDNRIWWRKAEPILEADDDANGPWAFYGDYVGGISFSKDNSDYIFEQVWAMQEGLA